MIPVLPGFLNAATTEGGVVADPNFLDQLYRYGVFVAFGISAVAYVALIAAAGRRAGHGDGDVDFAELAGVGASHVRRGA